MPETRPSARSFRSRRFYVEVLGGEAVLEGDRGSEIRCYMRGPDGHLIEAGQLVGRPED